MLGSLHPIQKVAEGSRSSTLWYSHVSGLWQLWPWRKYWGFSMTGMRVMPMTTVSGPVSSEEGVVMPWLMWCRGLAESSSPLMTATGPAGWEKGHQELPPE